MADLCVRAPAKINLHLEVLGLRPDGFHELAMLMQSIDLADSLRMRPTADGQISLQCDRADLPTNSSNLVVKAAEMLRARSGFAELGAQIVLEKRIPIGAGLAGGSSNGAAALLGLNELWGLGFKSHQLHSMAAELGSDMPFCLDGGTQLCFGRGEQLEALPFNSSEPPALLLIKHPEVSVSTPWAYGRCKELRGDFYLEAEADFEQRRQALRQAPLLGAIAGNGSWPPLRNDLQAVVEPDVETVRQGLALLRQSEQPLAVAMSGSGPTLFALFPGVDQARSAHADLAERFEQDGFESWCCGFSDRGVSLIQ
ncbi:MAG: 4-(cytidine 5'-diphospho)-2-C-methyl-D-erythritol kinase [Prochlorococcaceae cyanobacterium MAG_34]|jgi:4-diphosphocytidyl-2-C-methyl-D-erythritol kinase|nr:4-(cytidine 5'-diphospho)-2-C-methyl-D-erythritol kinase [Cyanobium sp. MAG_255]MDP4831586.1 4-(cytidine 5'-diphospho)-2-C-methyl-D-erythritol kinase [Cyanobium sp. MAG_185]MDP5119813.1 4-(cytidine 5'-diphospho)-2-C-methyl-D-erythritol kinase [Prochlorococcaceae cyanobacterium MAG_34]